MITIKEALRAALLGDTDLAALVGDRIFLGHAPEPAVYPLITYRFVAGSADNADGVPAIAKPRCEISVWGDEVDPTVRQVFKTMEGFRFHKRLVSFVELWDATVLKRRTAIDFQITGPM